MKKSILTIFIFVLIFSFIQVPTANAVEKKSHPALLVIDIQNMYLPMMDPADAGPGLKNINKAINLFREKGLPVIRVYHQDPKQGPNPGTEAFEFPKSILVKDTDPKIVKHYPSSFTKTNLKELLDKKGVNTVYLCGLSSVGCVLGTYFGAYENSVKGYFIKDALISHKRKYTKMIEEIYRAVDLTKVEENLK